MKTILVLIISYIFGSIPWALIIGKLFFNKDIRNEGSGNLGASNAGRVLGKPVAVAVALLDGLKAFIAMTIAHFVIPGTEIYAGLAACFGHCFPLFANFKGGKAVATSYGFLLGIVVYLTNQYFLQFLLPIISFFIILYITKTVSLSSISSLLIVCIVSFILALLNKITFDIPIALLLLWLFVTYRHKDNIKRIKEGKESKISWM